VGHDNSVICFARETKGTKNFEKQRGTEAEKIRCGRKHFKSLGVGFDVVTSPAVDLKTGNLSGSVCSPNEC
jgi:type III restriction enzyme